MEFIVIHDFEETVGFNCKCKHEVVQSNKELTFFVGCR